MFNSIIQNQNILTSTTFAHCYVPLSGQYYICASTILNSRICDFVLALFARAENWRCFVAISRGVKDRISFRNRSLHRLQLRRNVLCSPIGTCTRCSIEGMCNLLQLKPALPTEKTARVFVTRRLHQLQPRWHAYFSTIGPCTSFSADGTCSFHRPESSSTAT